MFDVADEKPLPVPESLDTFLELFFGYMLGGVRADIVVCARKLAGITATMRYSTTALYGKDNAVGWLYVRPPAATPTPPRRELGG
jgi:hypothetical protein